MMRFVKVGKDVLHNIRQNSFLSFSSTKKELTVFDKIINKEIHANVVYEDDKCIAFKDIAPQAPIHIILIPKDRDDLTQLQKAEDRHKDILGHLMVKVAQIAKANNLQAGYRVVINDGKLGCGIQMVWPPGVSEEFLKDSIKLNGD